MAVEQEVIAAAIMIALLYCIYTLRMYTNTARSMEAEQQGRTQGGVLGLKPPLSLIFYKIFITCAKEIKCFRILFAC